MCSIDIAAVAPRGVVSIGAAVLAANAACPIGVVATNGADWTAAALAALAGGQEGSYHNTEPSSVSRQRKTRKRGSVYM